MKQFCFLSLDYAPGCDTTALQSDLLPFSNEILNYCDTDNGLTCPDMCSKITDWIKYQHVNCFDNQPVSSLYHGKVKGGTQSTLFYPIL